MSGRRRAVSQSWQPSKFHGLVFMLSTLVWSGSRRTASAVVVLAWTIGVASVTCDVGCSSALRGRGRSGLVLAAGLSICYAISHLVRRWSSWSDGPRHDSSAPHGDDNHILGHGARGCSPQRRSTPLGMPLENPNTAAGRGTTRTAQHVLYEPCPGQACTWLESCHFPFI